jgi:hypothetical protein
MRMTLQARAGFLILFSFMYLQTLQAGNDERDKKKTKATTVNKSRRLNFQEFDESYYSYRNQSADPELDKLRAQAKVSINEVDEQNRYIDYLSPADLNRLPIGLKKRVGNSTVKIAVTSAIFTSRYAELTVYAKVDIPQNNTTNVGANGTNNKTIFFGVKGLKLSKDGGLIGDAKLVLMGDYAIPINGNKTALVLKGGFDIQTGQGLDKTYISIDCNGFKELGLNADVEFPRSLLIPTDAQGNQIAGLVKANFSTIVSNWNDIIATIHLPSFEIKGIDGVGFKIDDAAIDLSDYRNNADIVFPQGYQQKYIGNDPGVLSLWRGVYAKELKVILPKSFVNKDSANKRVAFGVNDLVIDNNGITGSFFTENIIPIDKGSAAGWQFSVDSFRIALEANRLLRAGFGGRVGIPVNRTDSINQVPESEKRDMIKRKFLAYSAVMSSTGDYLCRVVTKDSLSFDVWKASVLLLPNSYIQLEGNKNAFRPSAMLHGRMDIASKTGTTGTERATKILDFKGIEFQGLHIQTQAPYLTAQYFGYNGAIKIGKFPVSIDSISLKTFSPTEVGIGFNLKVTMQDSAFSGKTRLYVVGKYVQEESLVKWKYDRLKIEDITINAQIGKVSLNGTVVFLDNDPKYGDGFKGNINLGIKFRQNDSLAVGVTAIFGNAGYRYWFVDGILQFPGDGIPVGPGLNINGFGGGAYYRMKKGDYTPGATVTTGFDYLPDSTAGLGLRASVLFNVGKKELDHGQASLEVAFNRHGGMRYIGFYGYAKIMAPLKLNELPGGNAVTFMQDQFKTIEDKIKGLSPDSLKGLMDTKVLDPTTAAKSLYNGSIPTSFDMDLRAVLGISYDFNNNIFHANFDLYVTTPGNFISGVGAGGRAGWAVLHIDPSIWYLHMGTPTDPIGIKIGIGPISVRTSSYFMLGHNLPAFPPLPVALQNLMIQNHIQYESNVGVGEAQDIKDGKGIAFGAGVSLNTGDVRFLILYASFQAGMGFDVMIKDYSNMICSQTNETPGINGWYAQGRVYAYLQGECGVRVKLGPIKKKIPIIKGAAIAVLEARLPKPSWFGGFLNINVRLLGGLVKVNLNLKFSFGDDCTLVQGTNGELDFDEFKVVTSVTPANNAQNVSLFARPVVNCLTPPEGPFELPADEEGASQETYRPHVSSIYFTKGGQQFGCIYKLSVDSTKITLYPDSAFTAQTDYTLNVKIQYQKLVSGTWINLTNTDGTPLLETTTVNFKTGDNPPNIPDENIGYMYPFKNQRFFYKNEISQGKIFTTTNRNDLFSSFNSWKAKFYKATGKVLIATTDVTYNGTAKLASYTIPPELETNTNYIMEMYGLGYVGGLVSDTTRPIIEVNFKTSNYTTLAAKINALQQMNPTPVVGRVESDVIDLQANVSQQYEGFELAELAPTPLTGNKPLIEAIAQLDNEYYYNNKIKDLLKYPTFFPSENIVIVRDTSITDIGLIPVKAISISSYYLNALTSGTYNTILYDRLPYIYDLNKVFNLDFIELRTKIINKKLSNMANAPLSYPMYEWYRPCWLCAKRQRMTQIWVDYFNSEAYRNSLSTGNINQIPVEMRDIVTKPFPFMTMGDYKVDFAIKQATSWNGPDNFNYTRGNGALFTYHNPIETQFFNELQTGTFTRSNNTCGSGETGGSVTYSIPAGTYSSTVSQAAANQLAINALNEQGQAYANQNGTCCSNGSCYVPGIVTINLTSYISDCYYNSFSISFEGSQGTYYYNFPTGWYGDYISITLPAGAYNVTMTSDNYNGGNQFTLDNPWQSWYSNYANMYNFVMSGGDTYNFSISASCSGNQW